MKTFYSAVLLAGLLGAQSFDAVSIKPDPVTGGTSFTMFKARPAVHLTGNRFSLRQTTVQYLVMQAYGVWDYQISGLPDWAKAPNGEHYDVDATAGAVTPTPDEGQVMVQRLLEERFHLKLHRETKELAVFTLTIAKGGSKLHEITDNPRSGTTMQQLMNLLAVVVDRPILDKTGLAGAYDTTAVTALDWRKLGEEHRADPMSAPEALTGTLEDRLGLKLEPKKEPVEVLAIDRVEKPTAN